MSKKPKKLNVQGLARRAPELMRTIAARPGHVFVSIDLAAGEPSITAHFSGDTNYKYAVYDGVGKEPYYDSNGLLKIDDIYLTNMSKSPIGKDALEKAYAKIYDGRTFSQQWVVDKEVCLAEVKAERAINKVLALAIAYGMGPKTMVKNMYSQGYSLSFKDAKAFHHTYWYIFSGVKAFANSCTKVVDRTGYLVNPFGYRCTPEPHKAYNAFIQSSVSGLINVLCLKLFTIAAYARLVTIIHDEILVEVPIPLVETLRTDLGIAVASLNEDLGWAIKMRTGFVAGRTFYEAK